MKVEPSHSTGPFNPDWTFQKDKLWVCTQFFTAHVLSHDETRCFTGAPLFSGFVRFWRCCKDFSHDAITSVSQVPADVTSVLKYSVTFSKFTFHHLRTFNCDHTKTFYIKPPESPTPPWKPKRSNAHMCEFSLKGQTLISDTSWNIDFDCHLSLVLIFSNCLTMT